MSLASLQASTHWRQRVGLQAFTLGAMPTSQLMPSIAEIAATGVHLIEFLYDWIDQPAAVLRQQLDDAGMRCPSIKVPPVPWGSDQPSLATTLDRVIDDAHVLGVECVVAMMYSPPGGRWPAPMASENTLQAIERVGRELSIDDWRRNAAQLNEWGLRLCEAQLRLAFHNTNFEFIPHDWSIGMHSLLTETDPALVSFELDTGYALSAGVDPTAWLEQHRGRFAMLHLKDVITTEAPNYRCFQAHWTHLGQGAGNWPAIIAAAERGGCQYYYIEQEPPFPARPIDSVRASLRYLDRIASVG